jgi:hypothetical protein
MFQHTPKRGVTRCTRREGVIVVSFAPRHGRNTQKYGRSRAGATPEVSCLWPNCVVAVEYLF